MTPIDPETQKYFDEYLDLFGHPGWQCFMKDMQESLNSDQATAKARCDTSEKWFEERGAQMKTERFLSFEDLIRNSYDEIQSQAAKTEESEDDD